MIQNAQRNAEKRRAKASFWARQQRREIKRTRVHALALVSLPFLDSYIWTLPSKSILTSRQMKYSGLYTALRYIQVSMYMSYGIFPFRIHMSNGIHQSRVINTTWTGILPEVIFISLLRGSICNRWLAVAGTVDTRSKNSLEFGRWAATQAGQGPEQERRELQSYLQTALPGPGRGNSVRLSPAPGQSIYRETLSLSRHPVQPANQMSFWHRNFQTKLCIRNLTKLHPFTFFKTNKIQYF